MDQQIRNFVWGSTEDARKIHLLSWEQLTVPKQYGGLGLRSMRTQNAALLAKLGWRILQEPQSLWSRVIRSKYCGSRLDTDIFQRRPRSSALWKGLVHGSQLLSKGLGMSVGNGSATFFWEHSWLQSTPLSSVAITPLPLDELGATVADLWTDSGWNWGVLSTRLPQAVLRRLESFSLTQDEEAIDRIFWHPTQSGEFSTGSAVKLLQDEGLLNHHQVWAFIWKVDAQQRARQFLYLVAHDVVLCNLVRFSRHLASSSACLRCQQPESIIHLLRDCSHISLTWQALAGDSLAPGFFSCSSIKDWILANIRKNDTWSATFAHMVWHAWKVRNRLVFEGKDEISGLSHRVVSITNAYRDAKLKCALGNSATFASSDEGPSESAWAPPPAGWLQLCVDAVSKGNPGPAGGGGIVRDDHGLFVEAFVFTCGVCDALRAELLAIYHALRYVEDHSTNKYIICSDSLTACNLLNAPVLSSHCPV